MGSGATDRVLLRQTPRRLRREEDSARACASSATSLEACDEVMHGAGVDWEVTMGRALGVGVYDAAADVARARRERKEKQGMSCSKSCGR